MPVPIVSCPSRIARVTVFARGARVTRRIELPDVLPTDAVDVVVAEITAQAEPGSARALVGGGRDVVGLRTRFVIPRAVGEPGPATARIRECEQICRTLERERSRCQERREVLTRTVLQPKPDARFAHIDPAARARDALAVVDLLQERIAALDARIHALAEQLEGATRNLQAAQIDASQGRSQAAVAVAAPHYELTIRLAPGGARLASLELDYVVHAARWWPAYTARLTSSGRAAWAVEALIGQQTGEDWRGIALSLSTADLVQDARLPELASLRLGKAQPPRRKGYRPPPEGLDAMFEGFDRALAAAPSLPAAPTNAAAGATPLRRRDAAATRTEAAAKAGKQDKSGTAVYRPPARPQAIAAPSDDFAAPPMAMPPPPPPAPPCVRAPMPATSAPPPGGMLRARSAAAADLTLAGGGGFGGAPTEEAPAEPAPPTAIEPTDLWLDFDVLVLVSTHLRIGRGRLQRGAGVGANAADAPVRAIADLHPAGTHDPRESRGLFDHTYDAAGTADIPSSLVPQRVPVMLADAGATPRFRTVPRESPDVYREVELTNPFEAPLLAGPVDVFLDGTLLTTSTIAMVDRGGTMRLGLGIEDRLRVARNTRVQEASAGLLGGSTSVTHDVTIDLSSALGHAVTIEVVDRIPVADDKDVQISESPARPPGKAYDQTERSAPVRGGRRWSVALAPGGKARIEFGYTVTLPAKSEIVGGNRRE